MTDRSTDTDAAFPYSVPKINSGYQVGISKREYAAIQLRVPDSGTAWLDEMISKSNGVQ